MDSAREEVRLVSGRGGDYASLDLGIPTDQVDSLVANVIDAYQSSSRSLWQCAEYTWRLFDSYGLYERQFTEQLCSALAVQRDTLYHWRKAWDLRVEISEAFPNFIFDGLSISHFYAAADYVDLMGIEWVSEWLATAQEDNWSTRKLSVEMEQATDDSGTFSWLKKKLGIVLSRLEKLYSMSDYSGLSDDKRQKLKDALDLIQDIVK